MDAAAGADAERCQSARRVCRHQPQVGFARIDIDPDEFLVTVRAAQLIEPYLRETQGRRLLRFGQGQRPMTGRINPHLDLLTGSLGRAVQLQVRIYETRSRAALETREVVGQMRG